MKLTAHIERYPLRTPFVTAATTIDSIDVVVATVECDGLVGQGESAGVYYRNETPVRVLENIEALGGAIVSGLRRQKLQSLLPPGGARNALDCALWDLEAKQQARPAWQLAGLSEPKKLVTFMTCGAAEPDEMARAAHDYRAQAIKIKLLGDDRDASRVRAVRDAVPEARLTIDANQGFTEKSLGALLPELVEARVELIEQPFRKGEEWRHDSVKSPIPFAADESVETLDDLPDLAHHFSYINIKLDKCGGLTAGLMMAERARALGLKTYVGNMFGTSLAMAPAFLLAQMCDVVELDGPLFLTKDRPHAVEYVDGYIDCSEEVWGGTVSRRQGS
jgi:L-alanine-DL-glutamate epimerase-like enolase superfamily enzyme